VCVGSVFTGAVCRGGSPYSESVISTGALIPIGRAPNINLRISVNQPPCPFVPGAMDPF
jgi:hypothetical protein